MSIPFPILDNTFFKDQFLITSYQIDSVAALTANKPPAHPGVLHPFLGQVMAALRDRDAAPGFDSPRCYCPPPIRFPEHVRFMTAEEILARWGWGEQEAAESPEYYGRLVEMLRDKQADEATAERAWERLALHGWDNGAYFHFRDEDEDEAVIGTPADLDLDDDEGASASIGNPAGVAVHNEEATTIGDPADVDWEDEPSDDDDGDGDVTMAEDDASASASRTLPNGLTEDDLAGFDPVIRANIIRLAAQDAEEDLSNVETIDEVSGWAVPPASDDDEAIEDEIRAWATSSSQDEDYDEEEYEEGWETDDDREGHASEENGNENEDDDEIVWPGWAAPGVGYPDPHDHAFPMYLVPHVMHENEWDEGGSTEYVYVRGGLVCCGYSGPPRRFDGCSQGRRGDDGVEDGDETDEEMDLDGSDEE